jgi:hypothetical protein
VWELEGPTPIFNISKILIHSISKCFLVKGDFYTPALQM